MSIDKLKRASGENFLAHNRSKEQPDEYAANYRTLIEQIPSVTYVAQLSYPYAFQYVSPQVQALLGYSLEDWGHDDSLWMRLIHPEDRARVLAQIRTGLQMDQLSPVEYRFNARDGHVVWVHDEAKMVQDEFGRPEFRQGMLLDITDHKLAEATLERKARELKALSHVAQTVLATLNLDVVLDRVIGEVFPLLEGAEGLSILLHRGDSLEFAAVRGPSAHVLTGKTISSNAGAAGQVLQTGMSLRVTEANSVLIDREIEQLTNYHTRDLIAVPLKVGDTIIGVIEAVHRSAGIFTDDHLRLLEAAGNWAAIAIENARLFNQVETAKKEWEVTIDALGEGISLVDADFRVLRVNRTLAEWLGTTPQQVVGKFCYEVIDGCDAPPGSCPHAQMMESKGLRFQSESEHPRLGKTIQFTAYPLHRPDHTFVGSVNVLQDVTAERRLQAQLIQSEKLSAAGRLAASIAHEINNPLQAIQGCIELAETAMQDNLRQQRYLTMAKTELNRLATVVRRMLDFYRPTKGTRAWVNLRSLVEDVIALNARRLQESGVRVVMDWDVSLPNLHVVSDQLQQVFLNILLNAIEAMPHGGDLGIRGSISVNGWITIAFRDTGEGIAPEKLKAIFEPFYTTKSNGTGLGLGISQNIIENHRGRLTVESVPGNGSTFTVWLPLE